MRREWLRNPERMSWRRARRWDWWLKMGTWGHGGVCVKLHGLDWDVADQWCLYALPKAPKSLFLEDHRHHIPARKRCLSSFLRLLEVLHSDLRGEWPALVGFIPPSSLNESSIWEDREGKCALDQTQRALQEHSADGTG
jgi:hypothetical protein